MTITEAQFIVFPTMGIFNFSILPRDDKFYKFFEDLAVYCSKSVNLIEQLACHANDEAKRNQLSSEIDETKKNAKALYEQLSEESCISFITPFDREDLLQLGVLLYWNTKLVEKIKNRIVIHKLAMHNDDYLKLIKILKKDAEALQMLIKGLNKHNLADLQKANGLLHEYEESADDLLEHLIYELCHSDLPAPKIMVRKDLYKIFERLTDLYRDCGNIALQILLKHS